MPTSSPTLRSPSSPSPDRRPSASTSSPVRRSIVSREQRNVKKVIVEMGGKNALIVDSDADLDQAGSHHDRLHLRLLGTEMLGLLAA